MRNPCMGKRSTSMLLQLLVPTIRCFNIALILAHGRCLSCLRKRQTGPQWCQKSCWLAKTGSFPGHGMLRPHGNAMQELLAIYHEEHTGWAMPRPTDLPAWLLLGPSVIPGQAMLPNRRMGCSGTEAQLRCPSGWLLARLGTGRHPG